MALLQQTRAQIRHRTADIFGDLRMLTATGTAEANAGVTTTGATVNGSLATATAQANDGTVQIDLGTSDTHFHFFRLTPARDAT